MRLCAAIWTALSRLLIRITCRHFKIYSESVCQPPASLNIHSTSTALYSGLFLHISYAKCWLLVLSVCISGIFSSTGATCQFVYMLKLYVTTDALTAIAFLLKIAHIFNDASENQIIKSAFLNTFTYLYVFIASVVLHHFFHCITKRLCQHCSRYHCVSVCYTYAPCKSHSIELAGSLVWPQVAL